VLSSGKIRARIASAEVVYRYLASDFVAQQGGLNGIVDKVL